MSEVGRPTKYKESYNKQVYHLCLLGAKDAEIAECFEVNVDTIQEWKKVYPEFSDSIKKGKYIADMKIVNSLYNRAKGMTIRKQQAIKIKIDQHVEEVKVIDIEEELAPDTTSMIFWLKNRRPKEWRDKQEIDQNVNMKIEKIQVEILNTGVPLSSSENEIQ